MIAAHDIGLATTIDVLQTFLKQGLPSEFQKLTREQAEILQLALPAAYAIPANEQQRSKKKAHKMINSKLAQLNQKQQGKIEEKDREFFLLLVGIIIIAYGGVIVHLKSPSIVINNDGQVKNFGLQRSDLMVLWMAMTFIIALLLFGYMKLQKKGNFSFVFIGIQAIVTILLLRY